VDARVRHQVGLELGQVDVQRAVEAERRGERRDDLADQTVQVGVRRALDVEVATAQVFFFWQVLNTAIRSTKKYHTGAHSGAARVYMQYGLVCVGQS
jgi:pheromone shutdown protein TraB